MEVPALLYKTPLYQNHIAQNARMVNFCGWQMPVQYDGIIAEYLACRKKAAVFDICHMGEFLLTGDLETSGLNRVMTCTLDNMKIKTCRYGLMLNEQGGVIDDLIVFRLSEKEYWLVVNAANIDKDFAHLKKYLSLEADIKDKSTQTGKIDLQGPVSREVLEIIIPGIEKLKYYQFDLFDIEGESCIVSRTGYTGELGYEIFLPSEKTKKMWEKLLENDNVKSAGLGARDVLRIEMGYSLYGHEINDEISPIESGLEKFVDFSKEFVGKEALRVQTGKTPRRKIIYLVSDTRRAPRQGQKVFTQENKEIGYITSGTFSPEFQKGIGIALVSCAGIEESDKMLFGDSKKYFAATKYQKPFYKKGSYKI
ncbi:MAG: glycine cleavage system aminomethyltransferase GcvT [Candidatus Aceula meridiana]|nr:glycine cleavage system aminomethyltransferase GcvT [Candidatus Aceula meridiana]